MRSSSMQAAILEAHGAPFRLARIQRPEPGPGEVLVRIHASGINPLDVKIHAGAAPHARHPLPPSLAWIWRASSRRWVRASPVSAQVTRSMG
jgi:NADPH2:quinone reductase